MAAGMIAANVGLQVASGALNYFNAQDQADRQRAFQNVVRDLTIQSADQSFQQGVEDLAVQEIQDTTATAQAVEQTTIQAAEREATRKVAAAEAGVGGQSVDDLKRNFAAIELRQRSALAENLRRRNLGRVGAFRQLQTARLNQINSVRFQRVEDPDLLAHLIGTGTNVAATLPRT